MTTTMTQHDHVADISFTRDEQITALTQLIHDNPLVPQRRLARAIWNKANGRYVVEINDTLSETDTFTGVSFRRNALMLVRVPLATVYNRIRRITGKIK